MILGLFLSPGDSLTKQQKSGQLDRFINYYLKPYSKNFSKVYLFSYGDNNQQFKLPSNIILIPKPSFIPYQLHQLFLPFIHKNIIKTINIFRIFQAIGGLPALLIKKPFIVTYGYHYDKFAKVEGKPIKAKLLSWLIRPVLNSAGKIIITSKENQQYLQKLNHEKKIILIPNGVDPQIFKSTQSKQLSYLILAIGRLTHQKNHQLLLKTISLSKFKNKIKLIIIGRGFLKRFLQSQANELDIKLEIIDKIDHKKLPQWYQKTAVFALTSKIEGQPKVLLEAMSSGCACLTANFTGNLIKDGQTGMIADSAEKLSKKLDVLLINQKLRLNLGRAAREEILKFFDIKKLIKKEIKLLNQTAKQ